MHIFGEEISLDPEKEYVEVEEDDWSINREHRLMHHHRSDVMFFIDVNDVAKEAGAARLFDFVARPVHVCRGR